MRKLVLFVSLLFISVSVFSQQEGNTAIIGNTIKGYGITIDYEYDYSHMMSDVYIDGTDNYFQVFISVSGSSPFAVEIMIRYNIVDDQTSSIRSTYIEKSEISNRNLFLESVYDNINSAALQNFKEIGFDTRHSNNITKLLMELYRICFINKQQD
jgi:hypothetical protein